MICCQETSHGVETNVISVDEPVLRYGFSDVLKETMTDRGLKDEQQVLRTESRPWWQWRSTDATFCQCCTQTGNIETEVPMANTGGGTVHWEIEIDRQTGIKMGLAVQEDPPGILSVMKVKDGEGADIWNKANPSSAVLPGDVLVSVNGCTEIPRIIDECKRFSILRVEVVRTMPS